MLIAVKSPPNGRARTRPGRWVREDDRSGASLWPARPRRRAGAPWPAAVGRYGLSTSWQAAQTSACMLPLLAVLRVVNVLPQLQVTCVST